MVASGSVRQSFLNLPLVRASRSASSASSWTCLDRVQMARNQGVHADIRPDQPSPWSLGPMAFQWLHIDVNGLRRNHPGLLALPHEAREDLAEGLFAPALPDAGQRGVIRQGLVQGVTDEPADRGIDLLRASPRTDGGDALTRISRRS